MWYGFKGLCYRRKSRYIYIYVFFDCYISGLDKSKQNQTKLQFPSVVNKDLLGL